MLETPNPIRGDILTNTINRVLNYEPNISYDSMSSVTLDNGVPLLAITQRRFVIYCIAFYGSQQKGIPTDSKKFDIFGDEITPEVIERVKRELSGQR